MEFQGALLQEQGITFAIVVVKEEIIDDANRVKATLKQFQPFFPQYPIVLMAQNVLGHPIYVGRPDLVEFLSKVPLKAIPWKKFSLQLPSNPAR